MIGRKKDRRACDGTFFTRRDFLYFLSSAFIPHFLTGCGKTSKDKMAVRLSKWERGIAVTSPKQEDMTVYLWFYEWNMFDAIREGQNTRGTFKNEIYVAEDQSSGSIVSASLGFSLSVRAGADSADLALRITNQSDHDWPELASIIPCFNPGPKQIRNPEFANEATFFFGPEGLQPLVAREIHYNNALRGELDQHAHTWTESLDPRSKKGDRFVWSARWPDSEVNAHAGLIVRESTSGKWVTGIAWERFLSAQGHNPWECMHLSINIGPLERGQSREIRGKIYLIEGTKEQLLERYYQDFGKKNLQ